MEFLKIVLYVASSVIMLGAILFAPAVADTVSVFYVSILSTFLGIDVASMIQKTLQLPKGEYKSVKYSRYILCAVCYAVLIITGYAVKIKTGFEFNGMFTTFVSAIFVMITILIGALEGNKVATISKEKNSQIMHSAEN